MKNNELVDFKPVDYIVISIYLLIWGFIVISYNFSFLELKTVNRSIEQITLFAPTILLISYFKRLRVFKVNLTWLVLSVLQAMILFSFRNEKDFQHGTGSYFDLKYNLLIMLIMFFAFRLIYFYFFKQELIIVTKFANFNERKANYFDYFFTVLGIIILGLICPIIFMKLDFF